MTSKPSAGEYGRPTHADIAKRAHELFELRGHDHGRDLDDWLQAEKELRDRDRRWKVEATKASLTDDVETATLVLRLGIAVNAIRAAQRFYYTAKDATGPGGERDRVWAFLIAVGFLVEAIGLLRPKFPQVGLLAQAGGASDDLIQNTSALLSGRLPVNRVLDRMRNSLIFHWDEDPIREFVRRYTKDKVLWAEGIGDTQGEMIYGVAADSLTNSILPDEPNGEPESPERSLERLKDLMVDVVAATKSLTTFFDCAIRGHLLQTGAKGTHS
jgi:Protein of unknown function (DUF2934)